MREQENSEMTEPGESTEDESIILADQDETGSGVELSNVGLGGVDDEEGENGIGLDAGAFARGEVDVAEQVQRTTKAMDHVTGRGEKKAPPL